MTGSVALAIIASTWSVHFVYRSYYDCMSDALTQKAEKSCSKLIPEWLQKVNGVDTRN